MKIAALLLSIAAGSAQACSWNEPGRDPTTVPAARLAVSAYGVNAATAARIDALDYDRIVAIRKVDRLRDMSHGAGKVCHGAVDMSRWDDEHTEYAMAYRLPDGRTLVVAFVCHNLAWLEEETTNAEANSGTDAFDPEAILLAAPPGGGIGSSALDAANSTAGVQERSANLDGSAFSAPSQVQTQGAYSFVGGGAGFGDGGGSYYYSSTVNEGDSYLTVINYPEECCCDAPPVINPPIPTPVPEPWTAAMFAAGLGIVLKARRKS